MFWQRTLGVWMLGLGLAGLVQTVDDWRLVDRLVSGIHVYPSTTLEDAVSQGYFFVEVTPEQFAEHTDIGEHLRAWSEYQGDGPLPGYLSPEVWRVFQDNVIGQRNQFVVADTLYAAERVEDVRSVRHDVPGLAITFKITAGMCLMLGAWFLVKPYRTAAAKEGIHVAGPGFAVFGDTMNVLCTAVCAFMWLDLLLFHGLGQAGGLSVLNQWIFDDDLSTWDPVQRDAIYFAFAFGVLVTPALAALVTQRSGQAIRADADGVTSDGGFRTHFISWVALDEVVIESEDMPAFRTGLPATRRLQNKLVLRGEGSELAINEPARGDTKRKIVQMLVEQAPELVAEQIRDASRSW